MHISYILSEDIDPKGFTGASAHIRENIRNLRCLGHCVTLVANKKKENGQNRLKRIQKPGRSFYRTIVPESLKRVTVNYQARERHKELIASHLSTLEECDVIYERDAFQAFEICNMQLNMAKPWIIECNGFYWGEMTADFHRPIWEQAYKHKHLKKWMAAGHLIAVSSRFKEKMVAEGIPADKITVMHNGVNPKPYECLDFTKIENYRKSYQLTDDHLVIGFIGSILPWHRIDLLLQAIKELKKDYPVKGLIVGGGTWEFYRKKASDMGLDRDVIFAGKVDPHNVPLAVAAMDICTLPGSTDYNSPVKLFDYGAATKPVVAADFPAVTEIISDRITGLLFSKGELSSFILTLKVLLGDAAMRRRLGQNLHNDIIENYSWEKIARKTSRIIEQVAQGEAVQS